MSLRDKVIKLAYERPELRGDLLPLLKEAAQWSKKVHPKENKMTKALGLKPDQDISEYGSASAAVKALVSKFGEDEAASMINFAANLNKDKPFLQQMQKELKKNNKK